MKAIPVLSKSAFRLVFILILCYFRKLLSYYSQCKQLLEEVNQSLSYLDLLQEQYHSVSNKTKALHSSCEQLLQQQVFPIHYENQWKLNF